MWLTLAKWALLAFIAIGVTIFVEDDSTPGRSR